MLLVAVTIALSAFLLFLVQPIIAKQILPWFGGTSAVWTVCLLFFQVVLLGGYSYAHWLSTRAAPRAQARIHIGLLAASLLFLPIVAREGFKPAGEEDAAFAILGLLAATVGLPYFLLSSTGPLLQRWIAHRFPEKTVYRLFALSNFGSLAGLLAFPFLIEPFAPSRLQAYAWSAGYAAFALACAITAWRAQRALAAGAGVPVAAPGAAAPASATSNAAAAGAAAVPVPAAGAMASATAATWVARAPVPAASASSGSTGPTSAPASAALAPLSAAATPTQATAAVGELRATAAPGATGELVATAALGVTGALGAAGVPAPEPSTPAVATASAAAEPAADAGAGESRATPAERAPRAGDYAFWLALSALGSVLLLSTTAHVTQNIASVPFLWVLPLTLYLLTFVLAFEGRGGRGWYERRWWLFPTLLLAVAMSWGLSASRGVLDIGLAVPLYSAGLFFACLFCHGELAHAKPSPRWLTHFYLTVAAGGALGGLAVGLLAPRLFDAYYELPLALFALAALAAWLSLGSRTLIGPAVVAMVATAYSGWHYLDFLKENTIVMQRSFYGTLRVRETGSGERQVRRLLHGVILHGEQFTVASDRLEPGTYYSRSSGIGLAIAARQAAGPVKLGFVGLGVGTLSAYGRAGDALRFYELDPAVLRIARSHFGYLGASQADVDFVLGDARLSLERELKRQGGRGYDVLAIDAFSSDSIPVHLITREAIELYARHIAPDGIIAVHISNRFLDLKPVLANIAQATGLAAILVSDTPQDDRTASNTDWVLLARDPAALQEPRLAARAEPLPPAPGFSLWTDQFNNLLDVLKVRPLDELKGLFGG